jgi:DNA-directed RNA polymerase specialized sigma24 family protein
MILRWPKTVSRTEQRQVIELRYLDGRSHVEVAAALGKTVVATRALQRRAIKSLRKTLIE